MPEVSQSDALLISRIRAADPAAWQELIDRFEGRLLAFVTARIGRRSVGEDVVQETFLGFLTSLPNFDESRGLESYLFSIAAHKLTDHLRREGRRPTLPLSDSKTSEEIPLPARGRAVSSMMRSGERRGLEEVAISEALEQQIGRMVERGDWQKLQCLELLFVRSWPNKEIAARLSITEQQVANYKSDFLIRLRSLIGRQNLPPEVFPELYEEDPK